MAKEEPFEAFHPTEKGFDAEAKDSCPPARSRRKPQDRDEAADAVMSILWCTLAETLPIDPIPTVEPAAIPVGSSYRATIQPQIDKLIAQHGYNLKKFDFDPHKKLWTTLGENAVKAANGGPIDKSVLEHAWRETFGADPEEAHLPTTVDGKTELAGDFMWIYFTLGTRRAAPKPFDFDIIQEGRRLSRGWVWARINAEHEKSVEFPYEEVECCSLACGRRANRKAKKRINRTNFLDAWCETSKGMKLYFERLGRPPELYSVACA